MKVEEGGGGHGCIKADMLLSHPLLDEGMFVFHLPLLHSRVDDKLVQLNRTQTGVYEAGSKKKKKMHANTDIFLLS